MGELDQMVAGRKGPFTDGMTVEGLNMDNWGAQITLPQGPQYLEWTRRGYCFTARAAAAQALIIFSTATNAPTLWNPADSGKLVVPIRLQLHPVAVASAVHTGVVLGFQSGCGSVAATASPILTFTNKAPTNNCLATNKTAKTKYSDAVVTFTAIPSIFQDIGLVQNVDGTPATGGFSTLSYDFDGTVALGPGDIMSVFGQAASVNTFWMSILFAELPLAAGGLS
jgi:hypothetical protein